MGWVLEGQGQVQPQRGLVDGTGSGQAIRSSLDLAQAAWVQQRVDSNPFSQKCCLRSKVAPASPQPSLAPPGISENSPAPFCLSFLHMMDQTLNKALERLMGPMAQ